MASPQFAVLSRALNDIKEHVCAKCGAKAKGFAYRHRVPVYYCRQCLRDELSVIHPMR